MHLQKATHTTIHAVWRGVVSIGHNRDTAEGKLVVFNSTNVEASPSLTSGSSFIDAL